MADVSVEHRVLRLRLVQRRNGDATIIHERADILISRRVFEVSKLRINQRLKDTWTLFWAEVHHFRQHESSSRVESKDLTDLWSDTYLSESPDAVEGAVHRSFVRCAEAGFCIGCWPCCVKGL